MRYLLLLSWCITLSLFAWTHFSSSFVEPESIVANHPKDLRPHNNSPQTSPTCQQSSLSHPRQEETYEELMEDYLATLLVPNDEHNTSRHQIELNQEIRRIFQMDADESLAYWEMLQLYPATYSRDIQYLSFALIDNVALESPSEAISMILSSNQSSNHYYMDCRPVVTQWMDESGPEIMNLYEEFSRDENNDRLTRAMLQVYAEEYPADCIRKFATTDSYTIGYAVENLYKEQGLATWDFVVDNVQDPGFRNRAFSVICDELCSEKQSKQLIDFIIENQNQLSSGTVKTVAYEWLELVDETTTNQIESSIIWSIDHKLVDAEDYKIMNHLLTLHESDPQSASMFMDQLATRSPFTREQWQQRLEDELLDDDEIFTLSPFELPPDMPGAYTSSL